jgi:ubiquinone/menaquinone biosynthesis C-methylase UbiE
MPDAIFADPRLAQIYDAFDGERDDLDLYLRIAAELDAHRVVDVGCGTGSLALRLAETGRIVTGVEPAAASLAVARKKPGAAAVTWIDGEATALPALDADLAVMTGNVAQVFLSEAEWAATLSGIRCALRPRGYLVFESRRPERRAWEEWATQAAPAVRDVPGVGEVEQRIEVTTVALLFVSFRLTYRFASDGTVITSDSTLRFLDRAQFEDSLAACGFATLEVRNAPDRADQEDVFVAQRT